MPVSRVVTAPDRDHLAELIVDPEPAAWGRALASRDTSPEATRFREQLGLPPGVPIVMTGHQASFWHPGILAKYLAADAAAKRFDAAAAWLVADQDGGDPVDVAFPQRDAGGAWRRAHRRPGDADSPGSTTDSVAAGLAAIRRAWDDADGEADEPRRTARALAILLSELIDPAPIVFATQLSGTELFASIVARIASDPHACARSYNEAAESAPASGVRPLRAGADGQAETPLWLVHDDGSRLAASADDVRRLPPHRFAPRALLLTGLMRLAGCDLFVHGTGGGGAEGYDRVTQRWLAEWLHASLAPSAVVSATLRLDLGVDPIAADGARRAVWVARAARHDPALVGDSAAAARKRELVRAIAATTDRAERAILFNEMQRLLLRARADHGAELSRLDERAAAADDLAASAEVSRDRTWAFPLFPRERLIRLRDELRSRFGVAADTLER